MSSPIIIKTSQPDTEERLVLVPPGACTDYEDKPGRVRLVTTDARDATPADLGRGGFVLEKQPSQVAYLDMWNQRDAAITRAEKAEATLAMHGRPTYVEAVERAEKAERERDEARRLHSDAEAQVACRNELRAQVAAAEGRFRAAEAERDTLRAELARLAAPGEDGGPWRAYGEPTDQELVDAFEHAYRNAPSVRTHATAIRTLYRLGVAHERARHVEKDRATDEELGRVFGEAYTVEESPDHGVALRTAYLAVAARVRQERCLVAQAVAADCDIHVTEQISGMWCVRVVAQTSSTAAGVSATVPRADAPSTLARLLGEVAK